jgi:hypothetical protein
MNLQVIAGANLEYFIKYHNLFLSFF